MNTKNILLVAALAASLQTAARAQTNASGASAVVTAAHVNKAIIPVPRTDGSTNRQSLVLARAKNAPGDYDIEFIGDSITEGWEKSGKNVWQELGGKYKIINFGVGGDRTEHVLCRFEN